MTRLLYSVSKSFTGTALGLMIGEGKLSLDDLVIDHLPNILLMLIQRSTL